MRIAVYTHPGAWKREAELINALFEEGLEELHIRKPHWTTEQYIELIREIKAKFYDRIVLHHEYSLLKDLNFKGFHMTRGNLDDPEFMGMLPDLAKRQEVLSCSLHPGESPAVLHEAVTDVIVSPVFPSLSHRDGNIAWDVEDLRQMLGERDRDKSYWALGGIEPENIGQIGDLGFEGAALLGYIWNTSGNPLRHYQEVVRILDNWKMYAGTC